MGQILENGYELKTTFWDDFTIADKFGVDAIKDTFNRSFENWKENIIYVTELAMVMSWKSCHYYNKNEVYMNLYSELYHKVDEWCMGHFINSDLIYYIDTTD
jgi:hypothetical protein